jgi:hypothetical protein
MGHNEAAPAGSAFAGAVGWPSLTADGDHDERFSGRVRAVVLLGATLMLWTAIGLTIWLSVS